MARIRGADICENDVCRRSAPHNVKAYDTCNLPPSRSPRRIAGRLGSDVLRAGDGRKAINSNTVHTVVTDCRRTLIHGAIADEHVADSVIIGC